jgi:hypothetical protein
MKVINNVADIPKLLSKENIFWQKVVYEETGVIPILQKNQQNMVLYSDCGYIELNDDSESYIVNKIDITEYCEIKTIQELISYILKMESYQKYLCDTPLGMFSKAQLFWGVWSTLINASENQMRKDGSQRQDWVLFQIHAYNECLNLHFALIEYDDVYIEVNASESITLEEALTKVVYEMNDILANVVEIPQYKIHINKLLQPPKTFEELWATVCSGGLFDWIQERYI